MTNSGSNPDRELASVLSDIQDEIIEDGTAQDVNVPGLSRRDVLIGLIVNILLEGYELDLSHSAADDRVRTTLQRMMNEQEGSSDSYDDPVKRFREDWPEISGSKSTSAFELLLPIPVTGRADLLPGKIEFDGYTLRRIDLETWRRFEQRAHDQDAEDSDRYPPNLRVFLDRTALSEVTASEYTFWKFDAEGIDADYLIQQMESTLNVFLGQLSSVANRGVPLRMDHSLNEIRIGTRTVFRPPPFYLIFRDSVFYRVHPGDYPVEKPIPRIRDGFYYEDAMINFPSLGQIPSLSDSIYADDPSIHARSAEAQLGASFRTYGRAMRKKDPESVFLSLYRTLEHITFTKYAGSQEPLNRALRLLDAENDAPVNDLVKVVKDRRNTIVHEGIDVQITQTDLNLLKSLSTSAMGRVGKLSKSHETEQIIAHITTANIPARMSNIEHDITETEQKLVNKKEKLRILEKVQDW